MTSHTLSHVPTSTISTSMTTGLSSMTTGLTSMTTGSTSTTTRSTSMITSTMITGSPSISTTFHPTSM